VNFRRQIDANRHDAEQRARRCHYGRPSGGRHRISIIGEYSRDLAVLYEAQQQGAGACYHERQSYGSGRQRSGGRRAMYLMQEQVEFGDHEAKTSQRYCCANPCQEGAIGCELLSDIDR